MGSSLAYPDKVKYLQMSKLLQDAIVCIPIILYSVLVKRNEDCHSCFNRYQNVLFSRYQIRKDNCIAKDTLKSTTQKLASDGNSFSNDRDPPSVLSSITTTPRATGVFSKENTNQYAFDD